MSHPRVVEFENPLGQSRWQPQLRDGRKLYLVSTLLPDERRWAYPRWNYRPVLFRFRWWAVFYSWFADAREQRRQAKDAWQQTANTWVEKR